MKSQKGITIATLSVYVAAMTIIIAIISVILSFYNKNIITMNDIGDINLELNKFTTKMIQETNEPGNLITNLATIRITFKSGNTYTFQDNRIYQNTVEVANNVKEFTAKLETDGEKQILRIYIVLGKGQAEIVKNLSYVITTTGETDINTEVYPGTVQNGN